MIIYLAVGSITMSYECLAGADILSSYYYCRNNPRLTRQIPKMRNFLLDSGIFTFINSGVKVEIEDYIRKYADFIKENKIRDYVELDTDQIYGVKKTRDIRDRLENLVGWRSIPVWHTVRGVDSFIQDCRDYERICLGFFLTEGLPAQVTEKYTPRLIELAHQNNCKIHGLGFTKTTLLKKFPFDSVDSSTWTSGHRFGCLNRFNADKKVIEIIRRPAGKKAKGRLIQEYNFAQWRLYQDYAIRNIPTIN